MSTERSPAGGHVAPLPVGSTSPATGTGTGTGTASSSRATYLPTAYLAVLPPDSEISMGDLVAEQDRLADEAREAMPYAFDECSYAKGYLRQAVWSCIDCGEKGVCYGCSISCHAEHKLVELWTRRHFRCDCPTTSMQPEPDGVGVSAGSRPAKRRRCTLNLPQIQPAEANSENRYSENYKGEFCRCGRKYDPLVETEGMICCIACEDWFHESCLNLRSQTQPSHPTDSQTAVHNSTNASSQPGVSGSPSMETAASANGTQTAEAAANSTGRSNGHTEDGLAGEGDGEDDDDELGVLIPSDTYDGLICTACVARHPALRDRAGTAGWMMLSLTESGAYTVIGGTTGKRDEEVRADPDQPTALRTSRGTDIDETKPCAAVNEDEKPVPESTREGHASAIQLSVKRDFEEEGDSVERRPEKKVKIEHIVKASIGAGAGDVFLAHGEREKLKTELDAETIASLPFPLDDEEIYEPPRDEEKEETLDEMTARVVDNLPRAQAIEAVHGYQLLKDRLQGMLAMHASDGKVVSKEDIDAMFESLRRRTG